MAVKILLGIVQGITEFLPISSSGHLVFLKHIFGLESEGAFYETFLHTATFLSVIIVLRREIFNPKNLRKYLPLVVLGTLPLIPSVFLLEFFESKFSEPRVLFITFSISSVLIIFTKPFRRGGKEPKGFIAFMVGISQVLALLPGVSRSGTTIATGLYLGLKPEEAFKLSFWLFLPASLGAFILELRHVSSFDLAFEDLIAWLITFVVGVVALKVLKIFLISGIFWTFGIYTLIMGILSFMVFKGF